MFKSTATQSLPQIQTIHQIWLSGSNDLRVHHHDLYGNVQRMKQIHGIRNVRLWDKMQIDELLQQQYPYLVALYARFTPVMQLWFARYIILHCYGGIYVDVDCRPKKCLYYLVDAMMSRHNGCLPLVVLDHNEYAWNKKTTKKFISTFFMYVPYRQHALFTLILSEVHRHCKPHMFEPHLSYLLRSVGGIFFTRCIKKYKECTQREIKRAKHLSASLLMRSESSLGGGPSSMAMMSTRVHTQDIVQLCNVEAMDLFLYHNGNTLCIRQEWIRKMKSINRVKLVSAQVAVSAACLAALVIAL